MYPSVYPAEINHLLLFDFKNIINFQAQTQVYKEKIHELESKIKDLSSGMYFNKNMI